MSKTLKILFALLVAINIAWIATWQAVNQVYEESLNRATANLGAESSEYRILKRVGSYLMPSILGDKIGTSTVDSYAATSTASQFCLSGDTCRMTWPSGGGDMFKSVYDATNVSEQLTGLTATQTVSNKTFANANYLQFSSSPTGTLTATGTTYWNTSNGTLSTVVGGGSTLDHGEEMWYYAKNTSGSPISDGQVVMYNGTSGNSGNLNVKIGIVTSTTQSTLFMGMATQNIPNGGFGMVTWFGKVNGIQTNGANCGENWSDEDLLYVSTTTPGCLTKYEPQAPNPAILVASVISAHATNGTLFIRPTYPIRMTELADVDGTPLTSTGQLPVWDNSRGVFDFNYNLTNYPTFSLVGSGTVQTSGTLNELLNNTKEPTGFENQASSTYSFSTSTRTFTINPLSSSYTTYYRGKKITYSSATSTVISNTFGTHFIYFDSNGQIQDSTTVWDIAAADSVSIATVYWNASTSQSSVQDERHGITMDGATHAYLHSTVSSRYQSGFSLTADNTRATTTAGIIWDEDIRISQPQTTTYEVWNRRTDGNWDFTATGTQYYRSLTAGGTLLYDNAGASTTVPNTNYVAYWLFASDDRSVPIKVVMGQRQDTTLASAQANNTYSGLVLTGSPMANESKIIWRVIMRNVGGVATYIESQDQRAVSTLAGGGTAVIDHGTLAGLLDDDHTQYLLVDGTRAATVLTITGSTTFNGAVIDSYGSSGLAGMILQSTGTSTKWIDTSSLPFISNNYASSSFVTFNYATSTYVGLTYASSTFTTFSYSSSTFPTFTYSSSTFGQSYWKPLISTNTIASFNGSTTATTTFKIPADFRAITITGYLCRTNAGTSSFFIANGVATTSVLTCNPDTSGGSSSTTLSTDFAGSTFPKLYWVNNSLTFDAALSIKYTW